MLSFRRLLRAPRRDPPANRQRPSALLASCRTVSSASAEYDRQTLAAALASRRPRSSSSAEYVVVGAGSAGCVVAHRLAEAGHRVTLIEAGHHDKTNWLDWWKIHMPSALGFNIGSGSRSNWNFSTVPQKGLDGRVLDQPRGKVLGGSSSINAMAYVRGHAEDYERWARETNCESWRYRNVLPYFRKSQTHQMAMLKSDSAAKSVYRGDSGPLRVRRKRSPETKVLNDAFMHAGGVDAGYGRTSDMNGWSQEGFGEMDMTVEFENGERATTMNCYLRSARWPILRERVEVRTDCLVAGLVFAGEDAEGTGKPNIGSTVAKGVRVLDAKTKEASTIYAEKEVILCAGAVGSVQILQSAGIGDPDFLKTLNIPTRVSLPDVGNNLEDHLEFYLQYLCTKPLSLYPYAATFFFSKYAFRQPVTAARVGLEWLGRGTGVAASNHFEVGGFIRTRADTNLTHPDVQFHFIPGIVVGQTDFLPEHGYQAHVGTMRPSSRGSIRIQAPLHADPLSKPLIDPNYLATQEDIEDHRAAFRLGTEVMEREGNAFQHYNGGRYNFADVDLESDAQIDAWVRRNSHSGYHLSCTCKMGKVVDAEGARVFGVEGLRIIDASVMPHMTSGNLNAPTIMLAEKLVDSILGRQEVAEEDVEWFKPDLNRQRQAEGRMAGQDI